ncbi:glycosyltransferase family 2 protein [Pseudomonas parafulva]|uniref:glycosyltransferase family 2 protein n=1 Tax=Pseudomonas parafulva TaxID=157782 RepID=UPI000403DDC7|nr:glycosyltransferase family 2 protein [Pseudomonas parafulva]
MTHDLQQMPQAGQQPVAIQAFKGAILGLQGDVLQGWAIDTAQPDQRPVVEIFIDGAGIALARADQYEPQAPQGDQFHGFAVQLRESWLAEAKVISARIANQPFTLDGTVVLPASPSKQAPAFASQVWHTGGLRVAGWSWDPQSPNRHVQITVREGDQIVGQATCNTHHQALAYRATSDHGFTLDLPWELADGKVHVLDIVNDQEQPLAGSPIRVCCRPEGAVGLLRQLDSRHDPDILALLSEITQEQEQLLAKSSGWQHYPTWFEAFQRLENLERPAVKAKVGLLLISEGNKDGEHKSLASLEGYLDQVHHLVTALSSELIPALRQLLAEGCDSILPLAAGDRLAPHALPHLCALLDDGSDWAYADCDRDGPEGERSVPWFKPTWDLDLFIGADIFSPGAIFSAHIVERALSLLEQSDEPLTIGWHTVMAAIALATHYNSASVIHLPRVLYHRANDTPASPELAEPCAQRLNAAEWLCRTLEPGAIVSRVAQYPALLRAHWPLPDELPRVTLIVPTRDQYKLLHECLEGLLTRTDYPNLEIVVVDNQSTDHQTLDYLTSVQTRGVKVMRHPFPFNYSVINNRAADAATGDVIGLINNDIEIIEGCWLKEMVAQLMRPGVGAVGAKLLWPNGMVQHGGVVVGVNGLAAHTGNMLAEHDAGYLGNNQITRRQSAITAACMLMRKTVYDTVGGLDETAFPVAFNDVDLCLRLQDEGLHLVWTPFAKLIHAESASRGKDAAPEKRARALREQQKFIERWTLAHYNDPFYNPALALDYLTGPYGGLAIPVSSFARRKSTQLAAGTWGRNR